MAYYPATPFVPQFFTDVGVPLSGGTLTAYVTNTSTLTPMYIDNVGTSGGTTITLNARGEPAVSGNTVVIWLDSLIEYKFILKDSTGTSKWTINNINGVIDDGLVRVILNATGAVARTQESKNADFVNLRDFSGADPTGVTDSWAALSAAVTYCKLTGKKLYGSGNYLINTANGSIDIERVCIEGDGVYESATPYNNNGLVFSIIGTANSPFTLKRSWTFRGVNFFYPNITDTNPPLAHAPLFAGTYITQGVFDDCTVVNAYDFLKVNTGSAGIGDVRVNNCRIFAVRRTFDFANGVGEVLQVTNSLFSFGPYEDVATGSTYLLPYFTANGEFMHCDTSGGSVQAVSAQLSNVVCFGHRYGIRVSSGNFGIETGVGLAFDAVGTWLRVDGTGTFTNNPFVGCLAYCYRFGDTTASAAAVYAHGGVSQFNFTGMEFAFSQGHAIDIGGTNGTTLQLNGGRIANWGQTTLTPAAEYQAIAISDVGLTGHIQSSFYASHVGSNTCTGVGVAAVSKLDVIGCDFHGCDIPLHITGGTRVNVRNCSSTGTVSKDITYTTTAGVVRASGNDWSLPGATIAYPSFRGAKAASQTFNSGTAAVSVYGTETYDLDGNFASNTFTAPQTGKYSFKAVFFHDSTGTAGDRWTIGFYVNGSLTSTLSYKMIADFNSVVHTDSLQLTAADTVDVRVARVGGAGVFATQNDGSANFFCGELIQAV